MIMLYRTNNVILHHHMYDNVMSILIKIIHYSFKTELNSAGFEIPLHPRIVQASSTQVLAVCCRLFVRKAN